MNEFDVIGRINELCAARSWSYYRLAKESGISYSTLNTMFHKTYVPTIPSLMRICDGFGITLAQFFDLGADIAKLTKGQRACIEHWNRLNPQEQEMALAYMEGLASRLGPKGP